MNVVRPGAANKLGLRALNGATSEGLLNAYGDRVPLGRLGRPDDIAVAVSFLASEDASYVSGIGLFVDRGLAQVLASSARGTRYLPPRRPFRRHRSSSVRG